MSTVIAKCCHTQLVMDRSVGEPRDRRIREIHSPPRKDTEIYSPGKTNIQPCWDCWGVQVIAEGNRSHILLYFPANSFSEIGPSLSAKNLPNIEDVVIGVKRCSKECSCC